MEYILIGFPEIQDYMSYDWFKMECYLCTPFAHQEHVDSSYFVPLKRIKELEEEQKAELYSPKQ